MILLFSRTPLRHEDVHEALLQVGATRIVDEPLTGARKISEWRHQTTNISLSTDLNNGVAVLAMTGDDPAAARAAVQDICEWKSGARLLEELSQGEAPSAQFMEASALLTLGRFARMDAAIDQGQLAARLSALAKSTSAPVQHEALRAILGLGWPVFGGVIHEVASKQQGLSWLAPLWRQQEQVQHSAEVAQSAKQEQAARLASLEQALQAQRFDDAIEGARSFLESPAEEEQREALRTLALAYEGSAEMLPALLWAAAWRSSERRGQRAEAEALLRQLGTQLTSPQRVDLSLLQEVQGRVDEAELGEGLGLALQEAPIQHTELMLTAALLLQKSVTGETALLLSLLEPLLAASSSPRVWLAYGQARAEEPNKSAAEKAYRRAMELLEAKAESEQEALAAALEGTRAPSVTQVYTRLRELYQGSYPELYRIAAEELARPASEEPNARIATHRALALACTFTLRHEEAISAYQQNTAMRAAAGLAQDALLHFNLACELAKKGEQATALKELTIAASLDDTVAKRASEDEYFESLWSDPRFFVASVAFEGPPTPEEVQQNIRRASGYFYRGDSGKARVAGHRAVAGAAALNDDALLSGAMLVHGNALTYLTTPARGASLLEQAVKLAEGSAATTPGARAEAHHMLGAAYHAAQRFEEAAGQYQIALQQRLAAFGEKAPILAKSYGDLARLAMAQGQLTEAEALSRQAIELLREQLPQSQDEDEQLEMLSDLALLTGNQTSLASDAKQSPEDVIARAEETIHWIARLEAINAAAPAGLIERLRRVLAPYYKEKLPEALLKRVGVIATRLAEVEEPNARVREEKRYWLGLELGTQELKAQGISEQALAQAMKRALKGEELEAPIAAHPAFQGLSMQFAKRLSQKTDLIMIAMSLDLAISGATSLVEAIRSLQEFAVSNLLDSDGSEPEEEDELDDEYLDEDDEEDDDL